MIKREISDFDVAGKRERDLLPRLKEYIEYIKKDRPYHELIFVVYGLPGTGKRTAMEQAYACYHDTIKSAFYEVQVDDDNKTIKKLLGEAWDNDTRLIFLDGIERSRDFVRISSYLTNLFSVKGMCIVVSGDDSLSFDIAKRGELYCRTVDFHTTYMPYTEYCRMFGISRLADYLRFGGFMSAEKGKPVVTDYESACRYLEDAIAGNIKRSLERDSFRDYIKEISLEELCAIIKKAVSLFVGVFAEDALRRQMEKIKDGCSVQSILGIIDNGLLKLSSYPYFHRYDISEDFLTAINANRQGFKYVHKWMLWPLVEDLVRMDFLSYTEELIYEFKDEGWKISGSVFPNHIVQPVIKYCFLQKGLESIEQDESYKKLPEEVRNYIFGKINRKIFQHMAEQCIILDTRKALYNPRRSYDIDVCKIIFRKDGNLCAEYGMVVHRRYGMYWVFTINLSTEPSLKQEGYLKDEALRTAVDYGHGERQIAAVLYEGKSYINNDGIIYFNILEFLLAIELFRDMEKAIAALKAKLP
ncbi:MAG: hypothetical protein J6M57_00100 [Acidaminococcaceae bacterium]|nr:hypothetical protein [Acidaminococcaceae bacterium]